MKKRQQLKKATEAAAEILGYSAGSPKATRVLAAKQMARDARAIHKAGTSEERRLDARARGIARAIRWCQMFKGEPVCTECGAFGISADGIHQHFKADCTGIFITATEQDGTVTVEAAEIPAA